MIQGGWRDGGKERRKRKEKTQWTMVMIYLLEQTVYYNSGRRIQSESDIHYLTKTQGGTSPAKR